MNLTKEDLLAIRGIVQEEVEAKLEAKLAPIRTDIYYLKQMDDQLLKTLSLVQHAIVGISHDVAGLKCDVAGLKTDVAVLKTDLAILKSDVDKLKRAA